MHIFAADIYPLCDFDLKYYDTSCSNLEQKKLIINPTKMRPWRGRHLRLDKIKETVPNVLLQHCRVCSGKSFRKIGSTNSTSKNQL